MLNSSFRVPPKCCRIKCSRLNLVRKDNTIMALLSSDLLSRREQKIGQALHFESPGGFGARLRFPAPTSGEQLLPWQLWMEILDDAKQWRGEDAGSPSPVWACASITPHERTIKAVDEEGGPASSGSGPQTEPCEMFWAHRPVLVVRDSFYYSGGQYYGLHYFWNKPEHF